MCDGKVLKPWVIVWCTGFAPDYRWIGGVGADAAYIADQVAQRSEVMA